MCGINIRLHVVLTHVCVFLLKGREGCFYLNSDLCYITGTIVLTPPFFSLSLSLSLSLSVFLSLSNTHTHTHTHTHSLMSAWCVRPTSDPEEWSEALWQSLCVCMCVCVFVYACVCVYVRVCLYSMCVWWWRGSQKGIWGQSQPNKISASTLSSQNTHTHTHTFLDMHMQVHEQTFI